MVDEGGGDADCGTERNSGGVKAAMDWKATHNGYRLEHKGKTGG